MGGIGMKIFLSFYFIISALVNFKKYAINTGYSSLLRDRGGRTGFIILIEELSMR